MITAAQIIGQVTIVGADVAEAKLGATGKAADAAALRFTNLAAIGSGLLVAGLVAVGVKSAEMAGNFQAAVTRLYTTAGESKNALGMIGSGVLDMSTQVGTGAQTLIQAMYFVESAGFHGQKGLDVLRIAAMGAKTENSDLTSVVKTLVSTLNAYTGTGLTTAGAMNTLIAAVSQGHMTLNDLAGAISNILPATSHFHISLIDTAGAIAEMTKQGDNASSAATHLRQMILALEAPAHAGAAALASVGLTTQQVSDELKKSLPGTLQMIIDAVGKRFPEGSAAYNEALKNIAGGNKQLMGFLENTGAHLTDLNDIIRQMTGQVHAGGKSIMGWADVQQNFNFKLDQGKAAIEAAAIALGTKLLPIFGNIVSAITPVIGKFAEFVGGLNAGSPALAVMGGVLAGLAVIILAAVVPALISMGAAMLAAEIMGAPLMLVVLGVAAAVAGTILVIQHWSQIMQFLGGVLGWIGNLVGTIFSAIGTKIHDTLTEAKNFVGQKFSDMGTAVHDRLTELKNTVGQQFSNLGTLVHDSVTKTTTGVVDAFHWMYDHNTYVKALTDANVVMFSAMKTRTHDLVTGMVADVGQQFSHLGTLVHDSLTMTKNTVGGLFSTMGTIASQQATTLKNNVGQAFSNLGTVVHGSVAALWNDVTTQFTMAWSKISGPLQDVWRNTSQFFGNLASQAYQWGANMLGGFINGIWSQMQGLGNALGNAAGAVAGFLGFHSPTKLGPGRDADTWAPNFIRMYTQGLLAGVPSVNDALSRLMAPALSLSLAHTVSSVGTASRPAGAPNYSGLAYRAGAGSAPVVNVYVQQPDITMDGYRLTDRLMPHIANKIRYGVGGFGV